MNTVTRLHERIAGAHVEGMSHSTANRKEPPAEPENVFSNDEEEQKFLEAVIRAKEQAWIRSPMKWNTIHGIPWKRCDELGRGTYGAVYVGMREDNQLFAVKSIPIGYPLTPRSTFSIKCQISEIRMMRYMRCKYIIRSLGCGRSNGENGINCAETLDVFLEYVVRGSLKHVTALRHKTFEESPFIRQYTYDVLKALQYMRNCSIVHGDIKMGNLLLADNCVKLADWGGAKLLGKKNLNTILTGTAGFRPPEVLKREQQSYPSDIFSLGCTVIQMLTGRPPPDVTNMEETFASAKTIQFRLEMPKKASPECKDFLSQCLCMNMAERWSADELLHHPFIVNRDKTSKLPYDMAVPRRINASLLEPPRKNHPELPDNPMSSRVRKHLTGVSDSCIPNLLGCRLVNNVPPEQPLAAMSPSVYRRTSPKTQQPAPLPPFSPNLTIREVTKLNNALVQALCAGMEKLDSAPARTSGVVPKVATESQGKEEFYDAPEELPRVLFKSVVRVKEFQDSLTLSASLMQGLNDDLYHESKQAALEPLPEEAADDNNDGGDNLNKEPDASSRQLFPSLSPSSSSLTGSGHAAAKAATSAANQGNTKGGAPAKAARTSSTNQGQTKGGAAPQVATSSAHGGTKKGFWGFWRWR